MRGNVVPKENQAAPGEGLLGAWLASARIRHGYTLEEFSLSLRIQQFYLEALEREDFKSLPARAYVSGYVRSYALRAGLDPREANQRLQQVWPIEAAIMGNARTLNFADTRRSRWLTVRRVAAGMLVASIATYAAWYFDQVRGRKPAALSPVAELEKTPPANVAAAKNGPLPSHQARRVVLGPLAPVTLQEMPTEYLQQLVVGQAAKAKASQFEALPDGAFPRPRPDTPPALVWAKIYGHPSQAVDDPPGDTASEMPGHAPNNQMLEDSRLAAYLPKLQLRSDLGPLNPKVPTVVTIAHDRGPVKPPDISEPLNHGRTQAFAAVPHSDRQAHDRSAAPTSAVALLAEGAASWIEIKDRQGEVVLSRLLKDGQAVNVPNQRGLKLTTGNAGALVVTVNGVRLPALGRDRAVVRGVSLDPDRLLAHR